MANTKISDLPAVTDVISTDEYVLARSGATKKIDASDLVAGLSAVANDGWVAAGDTWTYGSADDPTYTFTIAGVDRTGVFSPGMRVRLSQVTGGTKYGIVTKVAFSTDTTVTLFMGTDYDLANQTISSPYYSTAKAPFGFPLDPLKWTVEARDDTSPDRQQATPTANTWYNVGSLSLAIPIGAWSVELEIAPYVSDATSTSWGVQATLSDANNTASDADFTGWVFGSSVTVILGTIYRRKHLALTSKTSYYANVRTTSSGLDNIFVATTESPTIIRAVCAYL